MLNRNRAPRLILMLAVLTGLAGGLSMPRAAFDEGIAQAAPARKPLNACPDPVIAEWTFSNTVVPSAGGGVFASGSGLVPPAPPPYAFLAGTSIYFSGWSTAAVLNTGDQEYMEFWVDTTGRTGIGFGFDYRSTGSGPQLLEVYYSTDGINYAAFAAPVPLNNDSAFHPLFFDFTSIPALEDNPSARFRIYAYDAGTATDDFGVDDVIFTGSCAYSSMMLLINEVAWAGTIASYDDEWIELYYPGSAILDFDADPGWRLIADDGSPDIALSGFIDPGISRYFLLERVSDQVTDVPGDQFFSGSLEDAGEILRLRAPDGSIVDTANSDGGAWPAGSISSYRSMERMGAIPDAPLAWVTFNDTLFIAQDAGGNDVHGTPGSPNWGFTVTHTLTPTSTSTPTATSTSPPSPPLTLLINEVAWMGTLASSSDEWIELYNPGASAVNLSNWKLNATDGSPAINLSGTIPAGGYFILASSSAVFNDLSINQTFSGSMSNEGEVLRLLDPSNTIVDTANSDSGAWPAGVASPTYATMERRGAVTDGFFSWSTFAGTAVTAHDRNANAIKGTPGGSNWGLTVTLTPTATPTATRTPTRASTSTSSALVGRPVINEFLARPGFDWNQDGSVDVFDEFIEIKNLGPVNIDLGGWKLDDEANLGSTPYTLTGVILRPGERAVFYGLETNLLLSDGGDTVRLLNPGGRIYDSYTYDIAKVEDESTCRLPDGNGSWFKDCVPTPNLTNTQEGEAPSMPQGSDFESPVCELPDTLPVDFLLAECRGYGANIWRAMFWDADGWQGEVFVQENFNKWHSFIE